jgi:hypothetical protein
MERDRSLIANSSLRFSPLDLFSQVAICVLEARLRTVDYSCLYLDRATDHLIVSALKA